MQDHTIINVDSSINSGQVFLWKKIEEKWIGINGQNVLKINEGGNIKQYENGNIDFFRKRDDIKKIIKSISKDSTTREAVRKYPGLRIIDQDPFQCLISFIVSSNSNIQKIKQNLENIVTKFGSKIRFENEEFSIFPKPKQIASASINEIYDCGVGYRAKYVKNAAEMIYSKEINLEDLRESSYEEAKVCIKNIPGVGNKVADCIMLFSLDKLEAFPLDIWTTRILQKYQKFEFDTKTITDKQYKKIHEKIVNHFGPYAGYSQQFLFKMEREKHQKNWL